MNELMFSDPFANMFKEMEAIMDFDFSRQSRGLKKLIKRPHNLITNKDENGKVTSFDLEVVYTPFKKSECKVKIQDNVLSVECGSENKVKDADMDYCGISHQSYSFALPLAECIDTKLITAIAEDGMLYINLPVKKLEDKKSTELEIQIQ